MEGLRNKAPSSIDAKSFQKSLNQEITEWTKRLESRLKKDSKTDKSSAIPDIKATEEQRRIAEEIVNHSQEIIDEALEIGSNNTENASDKNTDFFIFTSFSMGEKNLENLIKSSTKYNGIVVMRGFKDGDIKTTTAFLSKFIEKTGGGVIIDPELFKEYEIKRVPSFVLTKACKVVGSCNKKYDVLLGNVSPRFALEKFSIDGDLADDARRRLER